jgi:hypothetical protein
MAHVRGTVTIAVGKASYNEEGVLGALTRNAIGIRFRRRRPGATVPVDSAVPLREQSPVNSSGPNRGFVSPPRRESSLGR